MSKLTFTYSETENYDNGYAPVTRFTCDDTGAWVELHHDDSPAHPIEDCGDDNGIAIAFRERDHYDGTADAIPDDLAVDCTRCDGSGYDPERFELTHSYYGPIFASGSEAAMEILRDDDEDRGVTTYMDAATCPVCKGEGQTYVETIEEYVKIARGARAACVFGTGNYNEATAVIYITDDDWTDPQGAADAWADEYRKWADGEVYGIVTENGEDNCWGFIGYDYAKDSALTEYLAPLVEERRAKRERKTIRSNN